MTQWNVSELLDVGLDLEFDVMKDKCEKVLGIDPMTGGRDPNNYISPVLVKLMAMIVTGHDCMIHELSGGPSNKNFLMGYAIGYSSSTDYRFSLNGPKAIVQWLLGRGVPSEYNIYMYSPNARDSWYLAGIALPIINASQVLKGRWFQVYKDYYIDTGDDWSIADWRPFIEVLSSALLTLSGINTNVFSSDEGTPSVITNTFLSWPGQIDGKGYQRVGLPQDTVHLMNPQIYNANGVAMPDPTGSMGDWEIKNSYTLGDGQSGCGLIPETLDPNRTLTIERDASAKPAPEAVIGTDHKYMGPNGVKAKRYAEGKQHMIFIGPTGTAKTQAAIAVNEELGTEYVMFTGTEATETHELQGTWAGDGTGVPQWTDGPLVEAMRKGCCLILDELNRLRAVVQTALLPAMCGAMEVKIAHKNNEVVKAKEGFYVIACQNMGTGYAVFGQDSALFDRFQRQILFPYPESEIRELEILLNIIPEIDTEGLLEHAKIACSMASETRELYESGELGAISTRKLLEWMQQLVWNKQNGYGDNLEEASTDTVAIDVCGLTPSGGGLDQDNWNRFRETLQRKGGR